MEPNFSVSDFDALLQKKNALNNFCFLSSNGFAAQKGLNLNRYNFLSAMGSMDEVKTNKNSLSALQLFLNKHKNKWVFGFLSYDVKNEIEKLASKNTDNLKFPAIHFFVPHIVFISQNNKVKIINQSNGDKLFPKYKTTKMYLPNSRAGIKLKSRFTKQQYVAGVNKIKKHIQRGNVYEVTFSQEFYCANTIINPFETFVKLCSTSPAPMSCFYKTNNNFLISSSPERFLCRHGNTIYSQPVKGTMPRGKTKKQDEALKNKLIASEKERAENAMIVDLVRNDLSRIAKKGSVNVNELFGVYTFSKVHQLISTISCKADKSVNFTDIMKATFPMGSMTGAPKISAMKLIDTFEKSKRGLFSGCVGYIAPNGDFDFNVVIRSILYNAEKKYVSVYAGGAITALSDAEKEYEESLLKAHALLDVLK